MLFLPVSKNWVFDCWCHILYRLEFPIGTPEVLIWGMFFTNGQIQKCGYSKLCVLGFEKLSLTLSLVFHPLFPFIPWSSIFFFAACEWIALENLSCFCAFLIDLWALAFNPNKFFVAYFTLEGWELLESCAAPSNHWFLVVLVNLVPIRKEIALLCICVTHKGCDYKRHISLYNHKGSDSKKQFWWYLSNSCIPSFSTNN